MRRNLPAILLAGLLVSAASSARAGMLVLQPGPEDGKDAQLAGGDFANDNFGNFAQLISQFPNSPRSIGLIQFDLSALPADAVVTSATLTLYHLSNPNNMGIQYDVFRITSDWEELGVTFNKPPTFDPTAAASLVIPDDLASVYRDWDVTSLVQGWASGSFSNFGMWIEEIPVAGNGNAFFTSSDWSGTPTFRPKLTITYNVIPEPSALLLLSLGLAPLALGLRRAAHRRA